MINNKIVFIIFSVIAIIITYYVYDKYFSKEVRLGRIVILDGGSSSGKSTISKDLQKELSCEYLFIDNFLFNQTAAYLEEQIFLRESRKVKLPRNNPDAIRQYYNSMPNKEQYIISVEVFKKCVKKANEIMAKETKLLVLQGKTVVCDVVFAPGYIEKQDFIKDLKEFKKFMVLVYCPFKILAQRVEQRNKEAKKDKAGEVRSLIMALEQFGMKYKRKENLNKKAIDILTRKDFDLAMELVKGDFEINFVKELNKEALFNQRKYEIFVKTLEKQFGFDDKPVEFIEIVPVADYDLIVNTERNTSEECVLQIKGLINECRSNES